MRPELRVRVPSRRVGALAVILAMSMGVLLIAAGDSDAFGAAAGTSFSPCLPGTSTPRVHFVFATAPEPSADGLDLMAVSGLSRSGCDGSAAVLTISGNAAGDPKQAANEPLGTYDSRLDPCTQQKLANANVISDGAITFTGCATGGPAKYANLHDATHLVLTVDGSMLPTIVLGETITRPSPTATVRTAVKNGAELPFTGSYAALTVWLGLLFLVGGIALYVAGRRRRREA